MKFSTAARIVIFAGLAAAVSCRDIKEKEALKGGEMKIPVTSSAFKDGEMIPSKYTCDGSNLSPQLQWGKAPQGTKSFSLISDDPDAPMGTWVHWVIFNIPTDVTELPENVPHKETLDNGAKQGVNDSGKIGYSGPCPPGGTHRYYFKLYALDAEIGLKPGINKKQLLGAMEGHILAECQLMGKYKR